VRATDLVGRNVAERYEVVELLGRGGMANVYRAFDRRLEREVALKVLTTQSDAVRRRFLTEAHSLARLNHPGIIAIYDVGESEGISYIVMELAEGKTLRDAAASGMTTEAAVRAIAQVLEALQYAHEHDVLHRDIKPSNIVVRADGTVKIMDFGLARRISDLSAGTQAGEIAGTIPYLSPERFLGSPSDARSDLYSLGIVMYELFTGRVPFSDPSDNVVAVVYAHVHEPAAPPSKHDPNIAPELERIVVKAIEKSPKARYQSARELQHDLNAYLAGDPAARTRGANPLAHGG